MTLRQPVRLLKSLSLFFALASSSAIAAPGDHIRSGNLTVTPSLGVGLTYRSNAFRTPTNPMGTGFGALTPGVTVSSESRDLKLALGGSYTLQKYLFLTNTPDVDARRERISNLDRFNNVNLDASFSALPSGTVGFGGQYQLVLRNNPSSVDIDSDDPYTTQFRNNLGAHLDLRPGPALTISPGFGYTWTQFFLPTNDAVRDPFNTRNAYVGRVNANWRFLPRTSAVMLASYTANRWADPNPSSGGAVTTVNNSNLGSIQAGVQGRVSERLRVVLRAGSGFGGFQNSTSLGFVNGLQAVVQGTYDVTEQHNVMLGFRKSFFDSFFTNSVSVASIVAGWNGKYGDAFSSSLNIGTRFEHYDGPVTRNDQVTKLDLGLKYDVNEWANVGLQGGWLQRRSPSAPAAEYDVIDAGVQATFTY
ncbi:MAG: outer membrane beta-barrel protein [Alphaproteobacteria bacterium]|nr:outer membrane beta-barrel protein [Alphaproteobacteria bacterium]